MSDGKTLTDSEKCAIIAEALETRVGRLILAKTMVMPVKRAMGYKDSKVDLFFDWLYLNYLKRLDRWDASKFGKWVNSGIAKVKKILAWELRVLYALQSMKNRKMAKRNAIRQKELAKWREGKKLETEYEATCGDE